MFNKNLQSWGWFFQNFGFKNEIKIFEKLEVGSFTTFYESSFIRVSEAYWTFNENAIDLNNEYAIEIEKKIFEKETVKNCPKL